MLRLLTFIVVLMSRRLKKIIKVLFFSWNVAVICKFIYEIMLSK